MWTEERKFQRNTLLIISLVLVVFALSLVGIYTAKVIPRFKELEIEIMTHNARIIKNITENQLTIMNAKVAAILHWDLAYSFASGEPDSLYFLDENLADAALLDESYDAVAIIGNNGTSLFAREISEDKVSYQTPSAEFLHLLGKDSPLRPVDAAVTVMGFVTLHGRPAIAVSMPIEPHSFAALPAGRGIMLTYIDDVILESIIELSAQPLMFALPQNEMFGSWFKLVDKDNLFVMESEDHSYELGVMEFNLDGTPCFALYQIYGQSLSKSTARLFYFLAGALLVLIILVILFQTIFIKYVLLRPLSSIYNGIAGMQAGGHRTDLPVIGAPIFKNLASSINTMTETLVSKEAAFIASEEASKAKSIFLANMSHEIRTPLNGILGAAELMQTTNLSADQQEYVDIITKSGSSLISIINDVLDITKIESGKFELHNESFDLYELFTDSLSIFNHTLAAKDVKLNLSYPPTNPRRYFSDMGRVKQIINNLVSNAVKFTHDGEINVSVVYGTSVSPKGIPYTMIQITDTGIGIPAEVIPKLFQNFEQAEKTTTKKYGGTGLGLAITKKITEFMGGYITLESEYEKGSTFSVYLPMPIADNVEIVEQSANVCRTGGIACRVLVAEDNPINQKLASAMLEKLGSSVDVAGNGQIAFEMFKENDYDLVFMDCQMPEVDGYMATRMIREYERGMNGQRKPIIAMTANAMKGDRERSLEAGMDDHIVKPLSMEQLENTLEQWILRGIKND